MEGFDLGRRLFAVVATLLLGWLVKARRPETADPR